MICAGVSATVTTVNVSSPHIGRSLRLTPYNTHCRTMNASSVLVRYLRDASAFEESRRSSELVFEVKDTAVKWRSLLADLLKSGDRTFSLAAGDPSPIRSAWDGYCSHTIRQRILTWVPVPAQISDIQHKIAVS